MLDQVTLRVRQCFQCGDTLAEATARIKSRFANVDDQRIVQAWRWCQRTAPSGGSLPIWAFYGNEPFRRRKANVDAENAQCVGNGMNYGDWKGRTGPGKQLREILER